MTTLTQPLRRLAGALAELRARVRSALAGELARVIGDGVREVARAVIAGRHPEPPPMPDGDFRRSTRRSWDDEDDHWDRPHDRWDEDDAEDGYDRNAAAATQPTTANRSAGAAAVTAAVAAGVHAARWWLTRRGSIIGALALGVAVGLAGLAGGPSARAGLAALTAAGDLLAVSDALAAPPAGG